MNQERRNKRNAQYKINLEKRYGITKKFDYLDQVSDGIEKSEGLHPMDGQYMFELTRKKKGNIGAREKFVYRWTAQAKALQKLYHDTKNGIEAKPSKPIEKFFDVKRTKEEINDHKFSSFHYKLVEDLCTNNKQIQIIKVERTKEEIKEYFTKKNAERKIRSDNREFSAFHYKLIEGLYANNKQIQIIKNVEATAKHEQKIKDLMHKLMIRKANKPSYKLFKKTKTNNEKYFESLGIAA